MGNGVKLPDGIRPGVRVRNTRTGQYGRVANLLQRATKWAIMVHVEKPTGGRSGKLSTWKLKELVVVG